MVGANKKHFRKYGNRRRTNKGAGTEGISEITATESTALLIMSHHDTNKLVFDPVTGIPAVFSSGIQANICRSFSSDHKRLRYGRAWSVRFREGIEPRRRELDSRNKHRGRCTNSPPSRPPSYWGQIRDHSGDPRYTLEVAKFDAVNALSKVPKGKPYGPRALIFSLLGNGNVKLCAPPENMSSTKGLRVKLL